MSRKRTHRTDTRRRAVLGGLGLGLSAGGLGAVSSALAGEVSTTSAAPPLKTPATQAWLNEDPAFGNAPGYAAPMGFGLGTGSASDSTTAMNDPQLGAG